MSSILRHSSKLPRPIPRPWSRNSWQSGFSIGRRSLHLSNFSNGSSPSSLMNFVWSLIGVNTAVFAAIQYSSPAKSATSPGLPGLHATSNPTLYSNLRRNLPLSLKNVREGKYWTLVTSGFTHYGLMHFLGNMISLYAFGSVFARIPGFTVGRLAFLSFGSLVSGSAGFLIYQRREAPWRNVEGIGASGMVMGLGAAAACLAPKTSFLIYGVVPMPLWMLVGGYFAYDFFSLGSGSGTAHEGHLGGLSFGVLYYALSLRRFGGILAQRAITRSPTWRRR